MYFNVGRSPQRALGKPRGHLGVHGLEIAIVVATAGIASAIVVVAFAALEGPNGNLAS